MTRFLVFDVESTSLYGEGFAVGGVIMTSHGEITERFYARCEAETPYSDWVTTNIIPSLPPITHATPREMRTAFWQWMRGHMTSGAEVWADIGTPVESGFLRQCVADDSAREFEGPYPLHEIATALAIVKIDPDVDREVLAGVSGPKHNPVWDAEVSALCMALARRCIIAVGGNIPAACISSAP